MQGSPARKIRMKQRRTRWCKCCRQRPAVYVRRDGSSGARDDHDLCDICFSALIRRANRLRS